MGGKKLQNFYLIVTVKFDHCLRSRNDGGSPHEDDSFIFVAEVGLHAAKGKKNGILSN